MPTKWPEEEQRPAGRQWSLPINVAMPDDERRDPDWVHERGTTLSAELADALRERGLEVSPRDRTTLVSW